MNVMVPTAYFIVGVLSLLWMQKLIRVLDLRRLTVPSIFYLGYMTLLYVPSYFVAKQMAERARIDYIFAVMSVAFTVPLGVAFINMLSGFQAKEIRSFYSRSILLPSLSVHFRVTYFLVLVVAGLLMGIFLLDIPRIPLLDMLRMPGERLELAVARAEVTKLAELSLPRHLYAWLMDTIFPFLSLVALGVYCFYRRRAWLLIFGLVTAGAIICMLVALQRKYVFLLMAMLFLFYFIIREGRVRKRFYLFAAIGTIAIPYVVTLLRGTRSYLAGLERFWGVLDALIVHRLFVVPAEVLSSYFEIFPDIHPHLYGRSIGLLSTVMGWDFFPVARFVAQYRGASLETANANAAFIGFAYADAGLLGVVVAGVLAGCMLQAVNVWILRRRKTVFSYVLLVMVAVASLSLITTALPTVLLSKGLIPAILLVAVFKLVQSFLHQTVEAPRRI